MTLARGVKVRLFPAAVLIVWCAMTAIGCELTKGFHSDPDKMRLYVIVPATIAVLNLLVVLLANKLPYFVIPLASLAQLFVLVGVMCVWSGGV